MYRPFFADFQQDPFFRGQGMQMQQMQHMMMNPFTMPGFPTLGQPTPQPALAIRGQQQMVPAGMLHHPLAIRGQQQMAPAGGMFGGDLFGDMFGNMNHMMQNMHSQMGGVGSNPNGHVYSQSSVYTIDNSGGGAPKVYQAHHSTRQAPGGIKEVRRAVKDSEAGLEKMAIGHHIGERAHVIERSRNMRTRDEDEKQDFVNLDEGEAEQFDHEWQRQMEGAGQRDRRQRAAHRGITQGRDRRDRQRAIGDSQ